MKRKSHVLGYDHTYKHNLQPISQNRLREIQSLIPGSNRDISYSNGEINLCDMRLPPPTSSDQHPLVKKFRIPDEIPGDKVEEFFRQKKLDFEVYRVTATVNLDDRTITLSEFGKNDIEKWYKEKVLTPGPAINLNEVVSFAVPFDKKRENRLKDAWRFVQSQLEGVGIFSNLNLVDCCMEIATTTKTQDLDLFHKASDLLQLLSTTSVPSFMALEIFEGSRNHISIEIGTQHNGLCSKFGIKKDEYLKRWKCLFVCLEGLSKSARCHLFLNENTFTAVTTMGSSVEEFEGLPEIVENCIVRDVCPSTDFLDRSIDGCEDPHSKLEAFALFTSIQEKQVKRLQTSKRMVDRSLYDYKISYTLNSNDCSMAFSSIRSFNHPDIINNAGVLFELLSRTHVPASMAIEVLDGCLQAYLIKIGSQLGGLSSKHGIKNDEYVKRWRCLHYSLEALAEAGNCNVFLDEYTVTVVCNRSYGLRIIEEFVQACIVGNECPGNTSRIISILRYGLESIEDPHIKHMQNMCTLQDGFVNAAAFHTLLDDEQLEELEKGYSQLKSCLERLTISFQLFEADSSIMVSVTTENGFEDNIIDKTWDFVQLLFTNVAPSKALMVLEGSLQCSVIRTMYPPGVLPLKFGITMERFLERVRPRYESILEDLEECLDCEIINNEECVAVVGNLDDNIQMVRRCVLDSFDLLMGRGGSMRPSLRTRPIDSPNPNVLAIQ